MNLVELHMLRALREANVSVRAIPEVVEEHLSKVELEGQLPARLYPCSAKAR